ncbi:hypothetical protein [Edaphobacter aggregans]|nr:hypothetical protein [Edaphobacter aggregans]
MPLSRQTKRKVLDALLMRSEPIEGDTDLALTIVISELAFRIYP